MYGVRTEKGLRQALAQWGTREPQWNEIRGAIGCLCQTLWPPGCQKELAASVETGQGQRLAATKRWQWDGNALSGGRRQWTRSSSRVSRATLGQRPHAAAGVENMRPFKCGGIRYSESEPEYSSGGGYKGIYVRSTVINVLDATVRRSRKYCTVLSTVFYSDMNRRSIPGGYIPDSQLTNLEWTCQQEVSSTNICENIGL
ncbi:hypothetical protein BDZ91DRAFT_761719 [Kalaharituber pfeilii]|nr:hypothetical protein BDZ91DRAFT_761719 [Kalaharituber pfeilii]